jgi:hypothetical protein
MGDQDVITKAGELVEHLTAAAVQGASPHMDVRVRVGTLGPEYRINCLKGVNNDPRGAHLLIELCPVPESFG